jgi:hypothetical protein
MGFALVSLGLLILTILILIFKAGYGLGNYSTNSSYFRRLF